MQSTKFLFIATILVLSLFSCDKDNTPIVAGSNLTVTNTFESDAFTDGEELTIEALFMQPAGSLSATSEVSEDVEFSAYLLGLYDIDLDRKRIKFEVVAQENDTTYGDLFRILEANTKDRYYLTFDQDHNVEDFSSDNDAVNLRIDSDRVLVVEIGEGYDFKPGQNFTITLK